MDEKVIELCETCVHEDFGICRCPSDVKTVLDYTNYGCIVIECDKYWEDKR
jgi:hypothetical protein